MRPANADEDASLWRHPHLQHITPLQSEPRQPARHRGEPTLSFVGGGGGVICTPSGVFALIGSPDYSNAENNAIGGGFTVTDLRSCWFGEFRNIILGNNTVTGNAFDSSNPFGSDATQVANNEVFGNLACFGNVPDAQFGDSAQPPNVVFGAIRGEYKPLSIR